MQRPDVLLIILDTQRRDRLSTYGHTRETSPSLTRFAERATVFDRAIAPAQWTIPAHASIFTGQYAGTHGVTEASHSLSGAYPTLAEILQVEGYRTVGFCNNPLVGLLDNGLSRGFDHFYNYSGASPQRPIDVHRGPVRKALSRGFRRFAHRVQNQFAHSDWLFRVSLNPFLVPIWTRYVNYKGHTENSLADALDFVTAHHAGGNDQPLFTFVNLMNAHLPYRPPQQYVDRVAPHLRKDRHAYQFQRRFNADAARWAAPPEEPLQDWEYAVLHDFYDAEVTHQDDVLGRFLDGLRQQGILDNTLVIIAADHGEAHGDHGFIGHSFVVYQELVHVPLMVHYPETFPAGKRVQTNVSTRRIFHTVMDVTGITPPLDEADPNANVSSLTLHTSVNGRPDPESGVVYSEAFPPQTFLNVMKHRAPHMIDVMKLRQVRRGIYDGDHKLTTIGEHVDGLFDVFADPNEVRSIADAQPEMTDALRARLDAFSAEAALRRVDGNEFKDVDAEVVEHLRALGYID
ncbi:MAG: sulfatase-like hydrolase/transferase [Chloroflexota bacterium]